MAREYLEGRNIKSASIYPDLKTANEATKQVLKNNEAEIVKWLENAQINGKPETFIKKDFKKSIGGGIEKDNKGLTSKTKARVVLRKSGEDKFTIITSYPID